jgi:hypothetical protein
MDRLLRYWTLRCHPSSYVEGKSLREAQAMSLSKICFLQGNQDHVYRVSSCGWNLLQERCPWIPGFAISTPVEGRLVLPDFEASRAHPQTRKTTRSQSLENSLQQEDDTIRRRAKNTGWPELSATRAVVGQLTKCSSPKTPGLARDMDNDAESA